MGTDLATTATVHPAELVDDRRAPAPTSTDPRIVTTDRAALLIEEWLVGKAKTTATAYRSDLDAFALAVAELVGAPVTSTPEAVAALLSRSKGEAVTLTTAWMRTLNDVRLVMGTNLEIDHDEQPPPVPWDPTFPAWRSYSLLGNLVHEAVMALRTQL